MNQAINIATKLYFQHLFFVSSKLYAFLKKKVCFVVLLLSCLYSNLKCFCASLWFWQTNLKYNTRRLKCTQILWYYESKHLKFLGSDFSLKHLCLSFTRTDSTRVLAIQFPCLAQYYKTFPFTACKFAAFEERLSSW